MSDALICQFDYEVNNRTSAFLELIIPMSFCLNATKGLPIE